MLLTCELRWTLRSGQNRGHHNCTLSTNINAAPRSYRVKWLSLDISLFIISFVTLSSCFLCGDHTWMNIIVFYEIAHIYKTPLVSQSKPVHRYPRFNFSSPIRCVLLHLAFPCLLCVRLDFQCSFLISSEYFSMGTLDHPATIVSGLSTSNCIPWSL